nr:vegetative cell wall protein gp1-like [Aegilops tauschii subsp. strangulata]
MPAPPALPSSAPPDWIGGIEPPPPPGRPPPRPTSSTTTSPDCLHSVRVVSDLHLAPHCPVPTPRGEDPGPPLSPCTPTTLTTAAPSRARLRAEARALGSKRSPHARSRSRAPIAATASPCSDSANTAARWWPRPAFPLVGLV